MEKKILRSEMDEQGVIGRNEGNIGIYNEETSENQVEDGNVSCKHNKVKFEDEFGHEACDDAGTSPTNGNGIVTIIDREDVGEFKSKEEKSLKG
jgi:hypothetical protein